MCVCASLRGVFGGCWIELRPMTSPMMTPTIIIRMVASMLKIRVCFVCVGLSYARYFFTLSIFACLGFVKPRSSSVSVSSSCA